MSDATQVNTQGSLTFRLRDYHPLRSSFPVTLRTVRLDLAFNPAHRCIDGKALTYNPARATDTALHFSRFRLFPFRSPLLRESLLISVPPVTEMFHFAGFAERTYLRFQYALPRLHRGGHSHSEIPGSKPA